ncbi:MAG: nickel ABC transporter permease [bacterium]
MSSYLWNKLIFTLITVLGVITLVFFLIHLIPGDPVELMLGEMAQPADIVKLRNDLGLNKPITQQYICYISKLVKGNLGFSFRSNASVSSLIIKHFPATLELTIAAFIVALLISLPAGIISATKQFSVYDHGSMLFALLGVSMPNFWLGPLLILLFSVKMGWLPISGRGTIFHLILPAITLGTAMAAILTRMTRSSLLEVIREDYITTARAKGLKECRVIIKHALTNALIPVVTIVGLQIGSLLAGSIITETIFAWPGIGRLTIQAINARDYPLVQGCVLTIALSYVLVNALTDLVYAVIDPRIKYGKQGAAQV